MASPSLLDALFQVRKLLIDLERHLDRAAEEGGSVEVGRGWVRAAQVEQVLRTAVPPDVLEVAKAAEDADARGIRGGARPPI
jgi:hypothetical protein